MVPINSASGAFAAECRTTWSSIAQNVKSLSGTVFTTPPRPSFDVHPGAGANPASKSPGYSLRGVKTS